MTRGRLPSIPSSAVDSAPVATIIGRWLRSSVALVVVKAVISTTQGRAKSPSSRKVSMTTTATTSRIILPDTPSPSMPLNASPIASIVIATYALGGSRVVFTLASAPRSRSGSTATTPLSRLLFAVASPPIRTAHAVPVRLYFIPSTSTAIPFQPRLRRSGPSSLRSRRESEGPGRG